MCMECCSVPMHNGHPHFRRFLTKEERLKQMKKYAEELKNELKAVEEQINELSS